MADLFDEFGGGNPGPKKDLADEFGFGSNLKPEGKGLAGHARDAGLHLLKGAISVPELAVGLADIPAGGRVGKFLENEGGAFGFRPHEAKEILSDLHTDQYKQQQQDFSEADGVLDKTKVALQNPSLITGTLLESAPSIGAGGVAARGLMAAGAGQLAKRTAGKTAAEAAATRAKYAAAAAGAGEGAVMAGMQQSEIRGQTEDGLTTAAQSGSSLLTGVLGGLIGWGGGRLAQKLGIGDIDTMVAQGVGRKQIAEEIASAPAKSLPRKIIEGAISEGFLEELPQSVSEQIIQNLALDKPWHEGVKDAAVMGTLAGMAMGAGAAGMHGSVRAPGSQAENPAAPTGHPPIGGLPSGTPPAASQPFTGPNLPPDGPVRPVMHQPTSIDHEAMAAAGVTMPPVFDPAAIDAGLNLPPVTPSQRMGLDPSAGPMSAAAATAVDSGASPFASGFTPAPSISPAQLEAAGVTQAPVWSDTQASAYGLPTTAELATERQARQQEVFGGPVPPASLHPEIMHMAGVSPDPVLDAGTISKQAGIEPSTRARTEGDASSQSSRLGMTREQATPADQAGQAWDAMTTQERAVAIQAAGVTGVPAKHLATRTWESMSDKQRASLTEPVNAQQGSRWTDPNRRAKDQQGPVLQPRDRSQEKAIEQMANIAAKPDYAKASYSRTFTDGAPVTIDEISDLPTDQRGRQEQVTTAGDRKIPVQYAVVEADRLLASNDTTGAPNTDYAAGTAGKSRAIAGNGRVAGLTKAWERGTATQYKTDMMNDDLHGIDPAVIKRMKKPVLVRLMPQSEVTNDIGDVSNLDGKLSSTPVEQAKADGRAIDLASLKYNDEGGFGGDTARDFVNKLPGATNLISNGKVTQAGIDRLTAAVFQKAYNNDALTELLTESSEGARSVINALAQAAPHMTKLEGTLSFDIRSLVAQAAEVALTASRSKESLASVIQQTDMGVDPHVYPILEMMVNEKGNVRSAKYIAEQLINLANLAHYEATQPSADMFGERPQRTTQQLIDDAFSGVKGHVERTEQAETNSEQPGSAEDLGQQGRPEPTDQVDERPEGGRERPADPGATAQAEPAAQQQEVERPKNWRTNYIAAAKVARGLGINPQDHKKLADLVAAVDAHNQQQSPTEPAESAAPAQEERSFEVQLSENGKSVRVYGDHAEIRAKLREAGINLPGADIEGGLSFAARLEDRIREALNAQEEATEEITSQADDAPVDLEDDFDLQAQTEEQRAQQEADQKAQAEADAKQKAKEEAAARKRKEQEADKARADEVADSFELGQSSDEAMSGMGDMFGQSNLPQTVKPAAQQEVAESPVSIEGTEELTSALAWIARGSNLETKSDGSVLLNGKQILKLDRKPANINEVVRPLMEALRDAMSEEGTTWPTNPEQMSREQFAIAYSFGDIIPEFEITGADIGSVVTEGAGGALTVDPDALYDKILDQRHDRVNERIDQLSDEEAISALRAINESTRKNRASPHEALKSLHPDDSERALNIISQRALPQGQASEQATTKESEFKQLVNQLTGEPVSLTEAQTAAVRNALKASETKGAEFAIGRMLLADGDLHMEMVGKDGERTKVAKLGADNKVGESSVSVFALDDNPNNVQVVTDVRHAERGAQDARVAEVAAETDAEFNKAKMYRATQGASAGEQYVLQAGEWHRVINGKLSKLGSRKTDGQLIDSLERQMQYGQMEFVRDYAEAVAQKPQEPASQPEAENSKVTAHGVTVTVPAISKDLNDDYNRATHMGRGRDFNAELARETENIVNDLAGRKHTLETDEQKDKAAELIEDYLKNQADFMAWEARHAANNPSWFVTGRDGRNMAKASKANERHMDQYGARVERLEKQRKDIAKTLYDMRPESVKDSQANNKDLNEIAQLAGDILNYIKTSKPVLAKETRAWASPKAHKLMERALNADREGTIKTIQKMDAVQAVQDAGGLAAVFGPRSKAGKLVTELLAESKEAKTEPKFSFAGEKSGTAMHQELSRAKWLTAKGMTSEEVRQETGWHRGNDGKWRYEISDHDAKLKADAQTMGEVIDLATLNAMAEGRKRSTIGDVLEHDALFRAYPHLAEIPVIKLPNPKPNSVAAVGMIDGEFVVALNPQARGDYAVSALLHELQHAIQRFEGFARGGNSAMAARLQGLDALDKKAVNAYMRLQGEIEARNTQARRLMDDNFRKLFAPAETQDIQDKDAIVTFNGSELEDLTQAPAISRQEVRDVFAAQFPKLAKAIDRMLERGDKRQSGGLIILDSADPLMIARQYSDITGTNLSHAIRVFDNAEGAQGFFDQKSGLIFLVGPSVNADNVASVILHEALHSQQHKLVDDAAMAMLINRKHEKNAKTKAFLDRVARRMSRSQGGITHPEAAAYIVETALMEGRDGTRNEAVDGKLMDWIESNLGKAIADLVRSFATAYRQFALRNGLGVKVNVDDLIQYAQASMKQSAAEGAAPYGGTRGNGVQRSAAGQSPEDAAQVEAAIEGKDIHQIAEYLVSSMDSSRSAVAAAVAKKLKALARQGVKFDFRKTAIGTYAPSALNHSRGYTEFEFDESAALNVTVWMHGSEMTGRVGMDNEYILHELVHAATGAAVQLGRMHPKSEYSALNNALLDVREAVVERLLERRKELGDSGLTDFENDVLAGSNNSIQSEDEVLAWGLTNPGMQALMEDTKYKKVGAWGEFVSIIRQLLGLNKNADTALSELLRIADKLLDVEGYEAAQLRNIAKFGHPMYSTQGTRNKWGMANPVGSTDTGNTGDFSADTNDIRFSRAAAQTQASAQPAPSTPNTLAGPAASKWDDFVYKIQDKHVDTKRIVQAVKDTAGGISDALDTYLQETLYHGRAAKRTQDFVSKELGDLTRAMQQGGISKDALEEYLHARHAQEANEVLAERNPNQAMIDAGLARANATITRVQEALDADPRNKDLKRELKDAQLEAKKWRTAKPFKGTEAERNSLSGMSNAEAQAVLASLNPIQQRHMDRATGMIDAMIAKTRQEMVDYGLESQDTVDEWAAQWSHYIPLMREQLEDETGGMRGIGQGYSVKGREAKGRTGSNKQVVDILANIALQRERTIVRGEKNRVAQSLLGLARANSIDGFWTTDTVPTVREIDPATGLVRNRPDPTYRSKPNALIAKVDGKEVAVLFDEDNPRAMRMATAMKNLDAAQMEGLMGAVATATRYFAAVNTQYNPIFGVTNFVRDLQHAMLALSNTPLHGKQAEIAGNTFSAIGQVYRAERANRKGQTSGSQWGQLWEEFQQVGGQTGYRDQYANAADRGKAIEKALDPDAWAKSKLGRLITADGRLKAPLAAVRKAGGWLFDLLSDYNTAMENGVRLSAYKAGLDAGLSKERAAELAKNLTVNFNRKGQATQQIGAMYAFFNAAVQGTTRIGETLFEMEPGKPKTARLSKGGKAIMTGGVMLGSMQAVLLAAAGFGDDEPPEFIRERNLIIPTGGKTYISIPMPLGYHVITNLGRIPTEFALGGGKDAAKHMGSLMDVMADIYNPLGGAGLSLQSIAPTVIDPFAALAENKDFGGRAIAKQSFDKTTPGHQLARDNASLPATWLAQAINYVTGGTEFTRGELSPTPDQIDYLVGQITGGVGRELTKVGKTGQMAAQGDEWLWHNVPLLGRFIGDAGNSAGKQSAYYNALNDVNRHAAEVKGLRNSGRHEEASRYLSKHPEAGMQTIARATDKQIKNLRDMARDLTEQGASRAEVRAVEQQMISIMERFNRQMEARTR